MIDPALEKKLDAIAGLLQNLLALELAKQGLTHDEIRQRLHVGKDAVNKMLKGIEKVKTQK